MPQTFTGDPFITDACTNNVPASTDDAVIAAEIVVLLKTDLQNLVDMRILFRDDGPVEIRRNFFMRRHIAQKILDENSPQA